MKLTAAQAQELVRKLGVADAEIVADDAADAGFDLDSAIQAIDESRIAFHRPSIEQDVRAAADSAASGKLGGILRRSIAKRTGLSPSELEKIDKLDDVIEHALGKYKENLSGDTKTMQEAIERERAEWQEKEQQLVSEWEGKVKSERDRYYSREIGNTILSSLKDAPILAGADRNAVAGMIQERLGKDYLVEYDEATKNIKVIDKATNLPAKNKAGTGAFDPLEYARGVVEPLGLWQKDMRNQSPMAALDQHGNNAPSQPKHNRPDPSKDPVQQIRDLATTAAPAAAV